MDIRAPFRSALAAVTRTRLLRDVHERAADLGIWLPPGEKRAARLERIRRRGVLFVHVPMNAGTAISQALYGVQVRHASIRYYDHVAPDIVDAAPSFAVIRDPESRFLSAYRHARAGGTADRRVAAAFRAHDRRFRSIDDALDHVEACRSPYGIDHVFRPQSWYLTDRSGVIAVDDLVRLEDIGQIGAVLPYLGAIAIGHLDRGVPDETALTEVQRQRIRRVYAPDYELVNSVRRLQRTRIAARSFQAIPLAL